MLLICFFKSFLSSWLSTFFFGCIFRMLLFFYRLPNCTFFLCIFKSRSFIFVLNYLCLRCLIFTLTRCFYVLLFFFVSYCFFFFIDFSIVRFSYVFSRVVPLFLSTITYA